MRRLGALLRLLRAGFVLAREGFFGIFDASLMPASARPLVNLANLLTRSEAKRRSRQATLAQALTKLGPSYVKLGQFLATRPDLVGSKAARDLEALQDRMPAFEQDQAQAAIEAALGAKIKDIFESFGPAVAAASIAQVHRATLRRGQQDTQEPVPLEPDTGPQFKPYADYEEMGPAAPRDQIRSAGPAKPGHRDKRQNSNENHREVAVKVLRPMIEARFRRDLDSFTLGAELAERFVPAARRLRPRAVVDTLAQSVALEMDLRLEAAALSEMRDNIARANDPGFTIPDVVWVCTAKNVLTTQWITGTPIHDVQALGAQGHDLKALARTLMQSFLRHALRDGFFHADMHQGNLFVDSNGNIVAVDFGIMGRLGTRDRRALAEILFGFIRRDYTRVAQVHFEVNYVPDTHAIDDFAQALRAIGEPLHGRSAKDISMARLLTQLFEVTELFDMKTQPQLILLQKTMVVVEGVARMLDPELNMWATAEPVVRQWMEDHLGPGAKMREVGASAKAVARLVSDLPELIERAETTNKRLAQMAVRGLRLDDETLEALAAQDRARGRLGRYAIYGAALALVVIAIKLLGS